MSLAPDSPLLHVVAEPECHCAASIPEVAQWHAFSGGLVEFKDLLTNRIPKNDHVIWVVAKQRAARGSLPGMVVAGRPVGLMFANKAEEFSAQWFAGNSLPSHPQRAVLAQWDDTYLPLGRHWLRELRKNSKGKSIDWMANKIGGPRLCRQLATGARLCVYFGHGHSDGLAGYHGVYIDDFLAEPFLARIDTFLSFSCQNLAQPHGQPCLGRELVRSGRVQAFWGSVGPVATDANQELARLGIQILLNPKVVCIGDWIQIMDEKIQNENSRSLSSAWRLYRLVGNPVALI